MALLADFSFLQWTLCLALIGVCALLILIVLVQQASGGGLVGAFGGGGASGAFGAKTGDMFTVITVALATVFLLLSVAGNFAFRPVAEETTTPAITSTGTTPLPSPADLPADAGDKEPMGTPTSTAANDDATPDDASTASDDQTVDVDIDKPASDTGEPETTDPAKTDDSAGNP